MAKFHGKIGYVELLETSPGVWTENITEKEYCGDLIRNSRRYDRSEQLNDNLNISNQISIVADPYAINNFHAMRYVRFMNAVWKVTDVEVQFPRLVLTVGGLYNGEQAATTNETGSNP